jgi:hypothetical protein
MEKLKFLNQLVYLDRDYISSAYEAITGTAPSTQITKTEGKKAGAAIPVFSAEISAGETRSFMLSTTAMLQHLQPSFSAYPKITPQGVTRGNLSQVVWFSGNMNIFKVAITRQQSAHGNEEQDVASDKYFGIRGKDGLKLALLTTPEYFTSGYDSLMKVYETVLGEHLIPVKGLARVLPAKTDFQESIAIPLFIMEEECDESNSVA